MPKTNDPKNKNLRRRSNTAKWWFRRVWPKDVRDQLGHAVEKSLDTTDLIEARRKRDRLNLYMDAEIDRVRGRDLERARAEGRWWRQMLSELGEEARELPTVLWELEDRRNVAEDRGDTEELKKLEKIADAFHGVQTWREAGEEAVQKFDLADNTAQSYRRVWKKADETGLTPAAKLTREEAGQWFRDHAGGKSKSFRNQHRSALRLVVEYVHSEDKAEEIWGGHKVRVSKNTRGVRSITLNERRLILEHGTDWMSPASLVALATGLRQSELREKARLMPGSGGQEDRITVDDPKTPKGKRTFPLLPEIAELFRQRDDWPKPLSIKTLWGNAKKAAGFGEDVNWHSLRHTAVEIAMEIEIPYEVRGGIFGHEEGRGSEKSYTHVSQSRIDEAALKLQREVLERVGGPPKSTPKKGVTTP